jgi:hypothetical protein
MTSRTAVSKLGLGIAVAVLLVACGGNSEDDLSEAESRWSSTGIDDYELTIQIDCFCPLAGAIDAKVEDGEVVEVSPGEGVTAPDVATWNDWFTVEGLFDIVREDLDAERIDVSYSQQGYPTSIDIDRGEADDQLRILVDFSSG